MVSTSEQTDGTPPGSGRGRQLTFGSTIGWCCSFALCVGLASCVVTASARSLPVSCVEPLEVVDQVDGGVALLVGKSEEDVRFVPAGGLREGMVLSGGVVVTDCQAALYRRARALRGGFGLTNR